LFIAIAGLAMVLAAAFQRRLLWGAAMILLPIVYPLYALFNWSNARVRNGFLISIAGALIVFAALYGGVAKDLPFTEAELIAERVPTALPPHEPLPNEDAAGAIALPVGETFDPLADEQFEPPATPLSPRSDKLSSRIGPARKYAYYELRREHVRNHWGKTVKIVTRTGQVEEGVLVGSDAKSLLLETVRRKGSAAFEYRYRDLAAMYVYDHEPPTAKTFRRGGPAAWDKGNEADGVEDAPISAEGFVSGTPSSDELPSENDLPEAVKDLPLWAVPDSERGGWQSQETEFEREP